MRGGLYGRLEFRARHASPIVLRLAFNVPSPAWSRIGPHVVGHSGTDVVTPCARFDGEQRERVARIPDRARALLQTSFDVSHRTLRPVLDRYPGGAYGDVESPIVHAGVDVVSVGVDLDPPCASLIALVLDRQEDKGRNALTSSAIVSSVGSGAVADAFAELVAVFEHESGRLFVGLHVQGQDHEVANAGTRPRSSSLPFPCPEYGSRNLISNDGARRTFEHMAERHLALGIPMPGAERVIDHECVRDAADGARTRP